MPIRFRAPAVLLIALAACNNDLPTATITPLGEGPFATGEVVGFDAAASTDVNDPPLPMTFQWRMITAPPGSAAPTFGADQTVFSFTPDQYGDYTVGLIADDGKLVSAEATATVTVNPCGNAVPSVDGVTASPAAPGVSQAVSLVATVTDGDNDTACGLAQDESYSWSLTSVPVGSAAALSDVNAESPWFETDLPGDYLVRLVVTDATGRDSAPRLLTVTASDCGSAAPTVTGVVVSPASPVGGDLVQLAVSSADADSESPCSQPEAITTWSEIVEAPSGSAAVMSPSAGNTPAFRADVDGNYVVRTWVTDDTGLSTYTDTAISVGVCGLHVPDAQITVIAPYAAGPGPAVVVPNAIKGQIISLDAIGSVDLDFSSPCNLFGSLTYHWTFVQRPPASVAGFNDAWVRDPSFTPDVSGEYVVQLQTTDAQGHSDTATAKITATPIGRVITAPGYTLAYVAGESPGWSAPKGIAVDATGAIYVVQSGPGAISKTVGGITTWFSYGGYLAGAEDIVYNAPANKFFVTVTTFDGLIQLDTSGTQTMWTRPGDLNNPRSLSLFTNSGGQSRILVSDDGSNRVIFYDPTASAGATSTGFEDFGGVLQSPYGVDAAVIANTNIYYYADTQRNQVWRTDGNNDRTLNDALSQPHEVLRGPSGDLYIADSGRQTLYRMTDCGTAPCPLTPVAIGSWEPWGLAFESNTSLLVTDRTGNALYRITGTF